MHKHSNKIVSKSVCAKSETHSKKVAKSGKCSKTNALHAEVKEVDSCATVSATKLPITDLFNLAFLVGIGYGSLKMLSEQGKKDKVVQSALKENKPVVDRFMKFVQTVDASIKRRECERNRTSKKTSKNK